MVEQTKPKIFLSHATDDARIANALADVIRRVFAGGIDCWFSSDKSPAGGLAPGDQWYQKLHEQLSGASRVFAIVTEGSLDHPWIYWEAGIGSVTCPGHVVPVIFGLPTASLEPPLSYFQAVDGLSAEGLAAALGKVAEDADLAPDPDYLKETCAKFAASAETFVSPSGATTEQSSEEKVVAMIMGPLQNIQRRLEPLDQLVRRLDAVEDVSQLSLRRPSRLKINGIPLSLLEDLVSRPGGGCAVRRALESGRFHPGQVVEALEKLNYHEDIDPDDYGRAMESLSRCWARTSHLRSAEQEVADGEVDGKEE